MVEQKLCALVADRAFCCSYVVTKVWVFRNIFMPKLRWFLNLGAYVVLRVLPELLPAAATL